MNLDKLNKTYGELMGQGRELLAKAEEVKEQIEAMQKDENKEYMVRFDKAFRVDYTYIDDEGRIVIDSNVGIDFDKARIEIGNCYRPESIPDDYREILIKHNELRAMADYDGAWPAIAPAVYSIQYCRDRDIFVRTVSSTIQDSYFGFENVYKRDDAMEIIGQDNLRKMRLYRMPI